MLRPGSNAIAGIGARECGSDGSSPFRCPDGSTLVGRSDGSSALVGRSDGSRLRI
jgi:hypothetical protein